MRRSLLAALVLALALGLAAVAVAKVTVTRAGGTFTIKGTSGDDHVTVEEIPGIADPNRRFYAISDPRGVRRLPRGCFRFDADQIHCPVELVREFVFDMGGGNDEVEIEEGIVEEIVIEGDAGADELEGGERGDVLKGGPGGDRLRGDAGRDRLLGGGGRDRCNGGAGNDVQRSCEIGANY